MTFQITQEAADSGLFAGVYESPKSGNTHAVGWRREGPALLARPACGTFMPEKYAAVPLPAQVTCRNCLQQLRDMDAYAQAVRRMRDDAAALAAAEANEPVPATLAVPGRQPGPGELFLVTAQHVKDGLFEGVAAVQPGGQSHPFVTDERRGRVSFCGVNADTIDGRTRGIPAQWAELPAGVTCRLCAPKAAQKVTDFILFGPGLVADPQFAEDMTVEDQNAELRRLLTESLRTSEEYRSALEEGISTWRRQRGAMGAKISQLRHSVEVLTAANENVRAAASPAAGKVAAVSAEREGALRSAGVYKGLAGILLWKFAGPGTTVKEVVLSPVEYAAAAGQVVSVEARPADDGFVVLVARLRVPSGPESVFSEHERG